MGTATLDRVLQTVHAGASRSPLGVTNVVSKFQITIPVEVRRLYGLEEGDSIEWIFDRETRELVLVPKRPQLITPFVTEVMNEAKARRERDKQQAEKVNLQTARNPGH